MLPEPVPSRLQTQGILAIVSLVNEYLKLNVGFFSLPFLYNSGQFDDYLKNEIPCTWLTGLWANCDIAFQLIL